MKVRNSLIALALVLPLALLPAACADKDERDAVQNEELDRDLDLALQGDSAGVFEDTTAGMTPDTTGQVQPAPTYLLGELHKRLRAGESLGSAWAAAQQSLRSTPATAAPVHWAGWMLLGADR
jgi:hypothetical protein